VRGKTAADLILKVTLTLTLTLTVTPTLTLTITITLNITRNLTLTLTLTLILKDHIKGKKGGGTVPEGSLFDQVVDPVGSNDYPETVAVTLWGLDTIKTKGESVAILLALVGAVPFRLGLGLGLGLG
jgi:hypothetical protein